MRIAFTARGEDLSAPFDSRFGRAQKFVVFDDQTKEISVVDNRQGVEAARGAGIQAAEKLADQNVECLVTGHCGPNAFRVLSQAGIKVYYTEASTVGEALEKFQNGQVTEASAPDVGGHWR